MKIKCFQNRSWHYFGISDAGNPGFAISLTLVYYIPDLFPGFGPLLPLGFGQGAGEAYSIGYSWEAVDLKTAAISGFQLQ